MKLLYLQYKLVSGIQIYNYYICDKYIYNHLKTMHLLIYNINFFISNNRKGNKNAKNIDSIFIKLYT